MSLLTHPEMEFLPAMFPFTPDPSQRMFTGFGEPIEGACKDTLSADDEAFVTRLHSATGYLVVNRTTRACQRFSSRIAVATFLSTVSNPTEWDVSL